MKLFSEQQKLDALESMIRLYKESSLTPTEQHHLAVLKALANDCHARIPGAGDAAVVTMDRLLANVQREKTRQGHNGNTLIDLAQHVIGLWPTLRAALIERAEREKESA